EPDRRTPVSDPRGSLTLIDKAERDRLAEQERVRPLFERRDVRRIVLLTDSLDSPSLGRVEDALRKTHRRYAEYGRISVAQGLIIDPEHPGEAIVFAVTADADELKQLVANLRDEFPDRVSPRTEAASPSLVALLTDVDRVALVPGTPAGRLTPLDDL